MATTTIATEANIQEYACGFLFSLDRTQVLLIRKRRPAWQAGRLNGVGGKIEPGEAAQNAMRREFLEETGMDVRDWQHVVTLRGPDDAGSGRGWAGHFFRAFGDVSQARPITDEQLEVHSVRGVPGDVIPNLRWIIPLLLDDQAVAGTYEIHVYRNDGAN